MMDAAASLPGAAAVGGMGALGLAAALAMGLGPRLFHHAILRGLRAAQEPHDPLPALLQQAPAGAALQALRLPGPGGKTLAAWWLRPAQPADRQTFPVALLMHGWGSNASAMAPLVGPLLRAGLAVLLLDARGHGCSDPVEFTSMPRFAEDIGAGVAWLRGQIGVDGARLVLVGHSVGAAAALLYTARLAGPGEAPRAVISLSAFAHPQEVMRRWLAARRIPYVPIGRAVLRHVQRVIGTDFDAIAPLHTVAGLPAALLLVHGRDDDTVPFEDALRLQAAAPPGAQLLGVPGDHDLRAALADHEAPLLDFLARSLRGGPQVPAGSANG